MTDKAISDCCPELQGLIPQFIEKCASAGIVVKPLVTWRSATDQNDVKLKGLSNASAGHSPHNHVNPQGSPCSLAFDFGVFDQGHYVTDGSDKRYARAGAIAKGLGLGWGGDWSLHTDGCAPDYDHVQMTNWKQYQG